MRARQRQKPRANTSSQHEKFPLIAGRIYFHLPLSSTVEALSFTTEASSSTTEVLSSTTEALSSTTEVLSSNENQLQNLDGHKFRIVSVPYFPYMDYTLNDEDRSGQVIPRDSLDVRLINTFAAVTNFTFDIYAEPYRSFGDNINGCFTGMIGQLQREEADFSTIVAATQGRLKVVKFLLSYPSDVMAITSLKPALLPAYLSIIRPFSGELWVALLVSVGAWGMSLWLVERAWQWVAGGRPVDLITSLLYSWGALLQNLPSEPSINLSSQMLVGWWLVFCLVISTGFSSSLVAHLTVQRKSPTVDSFQDLVHLGNWKWGTEPWLYNGAAYEYFAKHTDPVVTKIYRNMEVMVADDALRRVLAGRFSLIDFKNYISVIVASRYTDSFGNTPFYISNQGISVIAAFGWGLRQGAPIYPRFLQLMSRLEDAGVIRYWTQDVISKRVKENRETAALDQKIGHRNTPQVRTQRTAMKLVKFQKEKYEAMFSTPINNIKVKDPDSVFMNDIQGPDNIINMNTNSEDFEREIDNMPMHAAPDPDS
nr:probable glutamate receptor [Procambarus clarkii]